MKTSELLGEHLNYFVAKCEGFKKIRISPPWKNRHGAYGNAQVMVSNKKSESHDFNPVENWAQGGPIIEREKIGLVYYPDMNCMTQEVLPKWLGSNVLHSATGPTPLIAAMRCYVASKLGDEVELLEGL